MKLDDIDLIPDGALGVNVASKQVLRAAVAGSTSLEERAAALVGAILLLVREEHDADKLIRTLAAALRAAAVISLVGQPVKPCGLPTCPRCNPPAPKSGGLPS